jgi:hypothetical protein
MTMLVLRSPADGQMVCIARPSDWNGSGYVAGYAGWELLEERSDPIPEHSTWDDATKAWIEDTAAKDAAEKAAAYTVMPRDELVTRMLALECALQQVKAVSVAAASAAGMSGDEIAAVAEGALPPSSVQLVPSPPDLAITAEVISALNTSLPGVVGKG